MPKFRIEREAVVRRFYYISADDKFSALALLEDKGPFACSTVGEDEGDEIFISVSEVEDDQPVDLNHLSK